MRIDILTLFPEMCEACLGESIVGRARAQGLIEINCRQIRSYSADRHNRVDDAPYGGGMGMIMQPQPIYDCYRALCEETGEKVRLIYMSPRGKRLDQDTVRRLARGGNFAVLCGHYEGVDERVIEEIDDEEISIGDYVLTAAARMSLKPPSCLPTASRACSRACSATTAALNRRATLTACWNIRSIRARRSGWAGRCRRSCSPAITKTSTAGAESRAFCAL